MIPLPLTRRTPASGGLKSFPLRSLARFRSSLEHQPVASYSAGRDIAAESESTTGTKFDITATDQIMPTATTTAIIHASILHPLYVALSLPIFRRPDVRQFTDARNFF